MGSPQFAVPSLEKLNDNPSITIELVISQEDKVRNRNKLVPTDVKKKAIELGLETYEPKSVNSRQALDKIHSIKPDFIVVIAFGQLIGDELLNTYKDRIINIHSSLLPKYRGAAPMQAAILNGDRETGVCSMLIEKKMDTGDILACEKMEIGKDTTIVDVHDTLSQKASNLIVDTILNFDNYYNNRKKQDDLSATYSKKIDKSMGKIDFHESGLTIDLKVRAFQNWPSTFVTLNDENVKIHKVSIIDKYNEAMIGEIIKVDDTGIYVNCKDSCVVIEEVQFPNKKRMKVSDFIRGNHIEVGSLFS